MKNLNEKSFNLIKMCAILIIVITCGFYYVLFADEFKSDESKEEALNSEAIVKKIEVRDDSEKDNIIKFVRNRNGIDENQNFIKEDNQKVDSKIVDNYDEKNNIELIKAEDCWVEKEPISDIETSGVGSEDVKLSNVEKLKKKAIVNGKVNINIANLEELQTLKNIGPKVASNIISYREENGNFFDIEEIKNVKGIGDKKFDTIKNYIFVE